MDAEDNAAVVRGFFDNLSEGKSLDALARLAEDVKLSGIKSKKDLQDLLERGGEELGKILNLEIMHVISQDDWVVVETKSTEQFITNGNTYTNEHLFLMRVDNQQIQEMREYRRTVNNKEEDSWIWPWPWPWPRLIETQNINVQRVYDYILQQGGTASMIWPWPWPRRP